MAGLMDDFADLGAGWFLFEDDDYGRRSVVCDALAANPNHHFGPAAWGGKPGPVAGQAILEAQAVNQGQWEQVSEDDWHWVSGDGAEHEQPLPSWPRRIVVLDSPSAPTLSTMEGRIVTDEAELVALLRNITPREGANLKLHGTSADGRMTHMQFMHPHIFGEPDTPMSSH